MLSREVDAVVIGCGVQGASAAYQLSHACGFTVAVVDQFQRGGVASRASAAMVTQQTGHVVTTALAKESVKLFRDLVASGWDIGFVECGYTTFASDSDSARYVQESADALAGGNVEAEYATGLAAAHLAEAVAGPFMSAARDAHATIYVKSDGYVDARKLVEAFLEHGAPGIVRVDSPVEAIEIILASENRVMGVRLASGETIPCSTVVNSAGAWAPEIGRQVGLTLPVRRSRRQMAVVQTEPRWDLSGIVEHLSHSDGEWYFRPADGGSVLVGTGSLRWLDEDDPLLETPAPDKDLNRLIGQYLQRNTITEAFEVTKAWAGDRPVTYGEPLPEDTGDALESGGTNVEVRDWFPMVGAHPEVAGYIDSCGWGEFGVTLAPIGGVLVAELVSGRPLRPELTKLASARFTDR